MKPGILIVVIIAVVGGVFGALNAGSKVLSMDTKLVTKEFHSGKATLDVPEGGKSVNSTRHLDGGVAYVEGYEYKKTAIVVTSTEEEYLEKPYNEMDKEELQKMLDLLVSLARTRSKGSVVSQTSASVPGAEAAREVVLELTIPGTNIEGVGVAVYALKGTRTYGTMVMGEKGELDKQAARRVLRTLKLK